jgi:glycosyltransferase involved in cell wall biosynthesis
MTNQPRITVVTPTLNQAAYLEQTLRSVLDQGYPNLEYIVVDGGSTDGTLDILKRYSHRLAWWVSEKDQGQANAINKGMARATGELRAYLNSDDLYLPGALDRIARAWREHPDADLFHGVCRLIGEQGRAIGRRCADIARFDEIVDVWGVWWKQKNFVQPEVFWTKKIADQIGPLREDLYFVMDYDYWARMLRAGARVRPVDEELAAFRLTSTQKSTHSEACAAELLSVAREYLWDRASPLPALLRWKLQAQWLYQTSFLPAVDASVGRGESRPQRLARVAGVLARNPKMLLSASLAQRAWHVVRGRLSALPA